MHWCAEGLALQCLSLRIGAACFQLVVYTKINIQVLDFKNVIMALCSMPCPNECYIYQTLFPHWDFLGTRLYGCTLLVTANQFTPLLYTCGHNCEQNDPHPQLSTFNDLPGWLTSFKWRSSSPSSPVHSQPSLLCVHNTCSWLRERLRLLLG